MAAVDEDGELNFPGAAKIIQRIHGRAGGAAGEEDIIHEHDGFASDVEGDLRGMNGGGGALIKIVAVHGDIEDADGNRMVPDAGENFAEARSEVIAQKRD